MQAHGRPIKYAEESNPDSPNFNPYGDYPPAATQAAELMKAEEDTDFFGAEYEAYLFKLAESIYPTHRNYQANV